VALAYLPIQLQQTLQDRVACFCAVVSSQTHDFKTLCNVFKASDSENKCIHFL
jgi:hypothetical protein